MSSCAALGFCWLLAGGVPFGTVESVIVTFSLAIGAADVAGQHAPQSQRAFWFAFAGGTTALCAWLGWSWLVKRAGRS